MTTKIKAPESIPPQQQDKQPGIEKEMNPRPIYDTGEKGKDRLKGKKALITGGDSGIGRAVAVLFAKEGCEVGIVYLDEHTDAAETAEAIRNYGKEPLLVATDISVEDNCKDVIEQFTDRFGDIDILVNNAAVQYPVESIENLEAAQLEKTFRVNIFSQFFMVKHALPYLPKGSVIINTASVTAYKGNDTLIDYASTKGAIVSFTRSLSQSLAEKEIRVNAVAPGPVWTPLIPSSYDKEKVGKFGKNIPEGRPAQPVEIAPCYLFLAADDSRFINGQTIHPNGGTVING